MNELIDRQRAFFRAGETRSLMARHAALGKLREAIERHEAQVLDALHADMGKSAQEAYASEIAYVLGDIRFALRHLSAWMKPIHHRTSVTLWPAKSMVVPQPYGLSLIIGPWNYPFQLLMSPLVSAVAAGNCAVLKPSEYAPRTSEVVASLIRDALPAGWVSVVEGDVAVSQALLREKFDKIFFTGGTEVGRAVMRSAAETLTPVTLELGGKCPCIVAADTPLETAARRILWGKFLNAGQTCVAPDHVWVERRVADQLIEAMKHVLSEFYGDDPQRSNDYGRIVNERHFDRLIAYLEDGIVEAGGAHDRDDRYLAPTLISRVKSDSALMKDEVFGPILPIRPYDDIEEVIEHLQEQPVPLALYLFTDERALQKRVLEQTRSGGVCLNDTISHLLNRRLPFGGMGDSGMGACHGKAGFDCFSHQRAVMKRSSKLEFRFRYPPLNYPVAQLKRILRFFGEC